MASAMSRFTAWWRSLFEPKRIELRQIQVSRTHVLRLNGISAFVMSVKNGGTCTTLCGWTTAHWAWNEGDYLILKRETGDTRYRIEKMTRPGDPYDLYFADCSFAPRGISAP